MALKVGSRGVISYENWYWRKAVLLNRPAGDVMPCLLKLQPVHVPLQPLSNEWGVSGVHLQVSTTVSHQEIKQKTHRNGVKINHQQDSILKSNPEMRAAHAWKCIHWKSFRKLNTLKRQHDTCVFQNMLFLWQGAFAFRNWTQVCPSVCESWLFFGFYP